MLVISKSSYKYMFQSYVSITLALVACTAEHINNIQLLVSVFLHTYRDYGTLMNRPDTLYVYSIFWLLLNM